VRFNIADLFEAVADTVPDRVAIVYGDRHLDYATLDGRATRLGHALAGRGIAAGEHVALYLHNAVEFIETMLACYKLRAVPFNVNYRYGAEELMQVLDDADAVAVLTEPELAPTVAAVRDKLAGLRLVAETGPEYERLIAEGGAERDFGERSADDVYLLYTGGTTGMPKGVLWRHEDIFFATLGGGNPGGPPIERPEQIRETILVNRAQRARPFLPEGAAEPKQFVGLALGPLMHASGQWTALSTLLAGGTVVLYVEPHMDMHRVLQLVHDHRVVMLTLVGDTSGRPLADALEDQPGRYDTSSLLLLGSGGSILSASVKERLLKALPTVLAISEAVGSSEAPVQGVAIARNGPQTSLQFSMRAETVVFDDALRPIAAGSGTVGRLATSGRIPLGYYKDPDKTRATFVEVDGVRWALPGDMATVAADGTIRLLGRGAMCINTGGEKVYPEEVEAVLLASDRVADAVIVGAPDEQWGERVVAVVAPRPGSALPDLTYVQDHCRARLAGYKVPRQLHVVDTVRRSPSGKPDYTWARSVAADG
jgi:acyl-CoA synthetase (AMP-forming)/AMP-acid ligase II